MAVPLLSRALAGGLLASLVACSSNHHVSPYADVDIGAIVRASRDLDGHLSQAERETRSAGLTEEARVEGKLPGGDRFLALGYAGVDVIGRPRHAVRVVTPSGIVLALGPADVRAGITSEPDTLLPSLLDGGGFPSGVDLTGDGAPDVAARAPDGTLAVYRIEPLSATRYPVRLLFPPLRVLDVNGDGRADLAGSARLPEGDPIAPDLLDVAIGDGVSFRDDHPDALAFHAAQSRKPPPAKGSPQLEVRAALERAFHDGMAGTDPVAVLRRADDAIAPLAPLPSSLSASWVRWRGTIADLLASRSER